MNIKSLKHVAALSTLLTAGAIGMAHADPGNVYNGTECMPANPADLDSFNYFGSLSVVSGTNHFVSCPLIKSSFVSTAPVAVQVFARDARCVLRSTVPGSDTVIQGPAVDFATNPILDTVGGTVRIPEAQFGSLHLICRLNGNGEIRSYLEL